MIRKIPYTIGIAALCFLVAIAALRAAARLVALGIMIKHLPWPWYVVIPLTAALIYLFVELMRRFEPRIRITRRKGTNELSARVEMRVVELFAATERDRVRSLLKQYQMPNSAQGTERIHLDVLNLSVGNVEKVVELVRLANTDYRDLIMTAEYELVDGKLVQRKQ